MTRDPIVITAPGPGLGEGVKQERVQSQAEQKLVIFLSRFKSHDCLNLQEYNPKSFTYAA